MACINLPQAATNDPQGEIAAEVLQMSKVSILSKTSPENKQLFDFDVRTTQHDSYCIKFSVKIIAIFL